jgi:hypothetical protein
MYFTGTDDKRSIHNEAMLAKVYPTLRPKIRAIISDMEGKGWKPVIDVGVYRTPAEQAEKKRNGYSKVSYSYHNVTGANGQPESLAADIVDARYGWDAPSSYWLQLASSAEAHGMETGIRWGLITPKRLIINALLRAKNWKAKYAMGWDAAHVQVTGITLGQAHAGKRPK